MNTTTLTVGDSVPDFSGIAVGAELAAGKPFRLSDYFDEQIVLYYYPQDHTPGCTAQACKLRDPWAEFGSRANLFGISTDSPESHRAFIELNSLPFPLISDTQRDIVRAYGVFLRGIYDPDRPVFKDYLATAIRDITRHGITNLIIDLRRNGGGEWTLVNQLAYHLTRRDDLRGAREFKYNPKVYAYYDSKGYKEYRSWYVNKFGAEPAPKQLLPMKEDPFFSDVTDPKSPYYVPPDRPVFSGRIIVLANQNTASAAADLTQLMQDNQLAVIVGTTTRSNPTGPTAMTPLKLPRSGILVSLPTEYRERAVPANGQILQPDYWVENSVADVQTGRDAAFEKALELFHPE